MLICFCTQDWDRFAALRLEILNLFEQFLLNDLKFCREENVDQHVWKILYHNPLESLKKAITSSATAGNSSGEPPDPQTVATKATCLKIIDEGMQQLERLLRSLEENYKFKLDDFIDNNAGGECKNLKQQIANRKTIQMLLFRLCFRWEICSVVEGPEVHYVGPGVDADTANVAGRSVALS